MSNPSRVALEDEAVSGDCVRMIGVRLCFVSPPNF
jgi:hypothetical protein